MRLAMLYHKASLRGDYGLNDINENNKERKLVLIYDILKELVIKLKGDSNELPAPVRDVLLTMKDMPYIKDSQKLKEYYDKILYIDIKKCVEEIYSDISMNDIIFGDEPRYLSLGNIDKFRDTEDYVDAIIESVEYRSLLANQKVSYSATKILKAIGYDNKDDCPKYFEGVLSQLDNSTITNLDDVFKLYHIPDELQPVIRNDHTHRRYHMIMAYNLGDSIYNIKNYLSDKSKVKISFDYVVACAMGLSNEELIKYYKNIEFNCRKIVSMYYNGVDFKTMMNVHESLINKK